MVFVTIFCMRGVGQGQNDQPLAFAKFFCKIILDGLFFIYS